MDYWTRQTLRKNLKPTTNRSRLSLHPLFSEKPQRRLKKPRPHPPVSGSPDNATKLNLAGWVIILLGAILSLQGGSWGFAVVAVVLVLGIGAIVQADRMRGSVSKPKLYATLAVALLVASGPYILVMVFPSNANIAVTDISVDEANDELDFAIRGSFSSVDVEIRSQGETLWSGSAEMTSDIKRFNVPINDFFDGNSEDFEGTVLKTYTISATSSNGNTVEMEVNTKFPLHGKPSTAVSSSRPMFQTPLRTAKRSRPTRASACKPLLGCSPTVKSR